METLQATPQKSLKSVYLFCGVALYCNRSATKDAFLLRVIHLQYLFSATYLLPENLNKQSKFFNETKNLAWFICAQFVKRFSLVAHLR